MRFKRRKIIMLLDNCTPHKVNLKLNNIKLVFFPPNVTSKLQPLDQGIINEVKKSYRANLVRKLIEKMDKQEEYVVDILEGIFRLNSAWSCTKQSVIANCFKKSGVMDSAVVESTDEVEIDLNLLPEELGRVDFGGATLEDYIHIDDMVSNSSLWLTYSR